MAGSEDIWEFKALIGNVYLIHHCEENCGGNYAWDKDDKWHNNRLHCYLCGREPPPDITTQAYLLPVEGAGKDD